MVLSWTPASSSSFVGPAGSGPSPSIASTTWMRSRAFDSFERSPAIARSTHGFPGNQHPRSGRNCIQHLQGDHSRIAQSRSAQSRSAATQPPGRTQPYTCVRTSSSPHCQTLRVTKQCDPSTQGTEMCAERSPDIRPTPDELRHSLLGRVCSKQSDRHTTAHLPSEREAAAKEFPFKRSC